MAIAANITALAGACMVPVAAATAAAAIGAANSAPDDAGVAAALWADFETAAAVTGAIPPIGAACACTGDAASTKNPMAAATPRQKLLIFNVFPLPLAADPKPGRRFGPSRHLLGSVFVRLALEPGATRFVGSLALNC